MKLLQCTMLAAVAVASASLSAAHVPSARVAFETGLMLGGEDEAMEIPTSFLRRSLEAEAGSNVGPTTAPPPPTTAPPPTTTAPPPTTAAPPPTTTAPPPTTTAPPTTAPPTTAPPTTSPPSTTTPAPSTTGPATTTPKPSENNSTKTPTPTTAGPSTTTPPTSEGSNEGTKTTAPAKTEPLTSNSQSGDQKTGNKSSKMSTGTIIGIVGGIVVGVGILAVIAVVLARKRREEDDDPLSPFELSMDKGYNGAGASGYAGQQPPTQNPNQYNNNTALSYGGGARQGHNGMAVAGAAAVGAAAGAGAAVMMTTDTPSANADAAGVAYTQFYDPVTSPTSMYHQDQTQTQHSTINMDSSRTDPSNNGSNLWMSAMEPKENDVEGASMPPEISLPGDRDIDTNSSFVSRNSYDELPGTSVDIDQSSVLSGSSDLDKDFPDYEDESSRGSYEL